jgi:hypothetical protein
VQGKAPGVAAQGIPLRVADLIVRVLQEDAKLIHAAEPDASVVSGAKPRRG